MTILVASKRTHASHTEQITDTAFQAFSYSISRDTSKDGFNHVKSEGFTLQQACSMSDPGIGEHIVSYLMPNLDSSSDHYIMHNDQNRQAHIFLDTMRQINKHCKEKLKKPEIKDRLFFDRRALQNEKKALETSSPDLEDDTSLQTKIDKTQQWTKAAAYRMQNDQPDLAFTNLNNAMNYAAQTRESFVDENGLNDILERNDGLRRVFKDNSDLKGILSVLGRILADNIETFDPEKIEKGDKMLDSAWALSLNTPGEGMISNAVKVTGLIGKAYALTGNIDKAKEAVSKIKGYEQLMNEQYSSSEFDSAQRWIRGLNRRINGIKPMTTEEWVKNPPRVNTGWIG